jgi:hypothetical protein
MKKLGQRLFRKKIVRASTQSSLDGSQAVPHSGFTFIKNSKGASAALSEFTTVISDALEHINSEGETL